MGFPSLPCYACLLFASVKILGSLPACSASTEELLQRVRGGAKIALSVAGPSCCKAERQLDNQWGDDFQ